MRHITILMTHPVLLSAQALAGSMLIIYLRDAALQAFLWFLPCAFAIAADLATGIHAAKFRNEKVSWSTALRRTINKVVAYLSWVLFAVTAGLQFGHSWCCPAMMAAVLLIEGMSIISNWLEPKGIRLSWKGVLAVIGHKASLDGLENVIERTGDEKD